MFRWLSALWRRDISTLGLWDVLRRRGLSRAASHDLQALAHAVERCTRCRGTSRCTRLLAGGQVEELAVFCPNAMYVAHLQAMKRHDPKQDLL